MIELDHRARVFCSAEERTTTRCRCSCPKPAARTSAHVVITNVEKCLMLCHTPMLVNNSSLQPSRRAAVRERQWRTAAQSGLTRLLRICSERSASRSSRRICACKWAAAFSLGRVPGCWIQGQSCSAATHSAELLMGGGRSRAGAACPERVLKRSHCVPALLRACPELRQLSARPRLGENR